ncbi:MAG: guanylate kinase [Nitrospirales bacterium]|nr:MAG: guanylate kinase [Nitrospirales bacterium]
MSHSGMLFILSGSSGVGKSTLCKRIMTSIPDVQLSVSYTTRPIRDGETHGIEYWFVDQSEFRRMIEQDAFLEWAEVYENFYGTPRQELVTRIDQGIDVILDVDVQGARNVMKNMPDAVSVFLLPPSLEVLKARLESRGTDKSDVVDRRFQKAQAEMAHYVEYDYTIRNGCLDQAIKEFESIIVAEHVRTKRLDHAWMSRHGLARQESNPVSSRTERERNVIS